LGLTVALLALGVAGCGDSDQQAESSGGDARATTDGSNTAPTQDGGGAGGAASERDGPELLGNRAHARASALAVDSVYGDLAAAVKDGAGATDMTVRDTLADSKGNASLASACELMSTEAKRETIDYARRSTGLAEADWTCATAVGLLLRRAERGGALKAALSAEVVSVNARGNLATATVRFPGSDQLSSVPLVREKGRWKLKGSVQGRTP
jgi:hypothetical protein